MSTKPTVPSGSRQVPLGARRLAIATLVALVVALPFAVSFEIRVAVFFYVFEAIGIALGVVVDFQIMRSAVVRILLLLTLLIPLVNVAVAVWFVVRTNREAR